METIMRSRKSFTFIEILISIVILTIVSSAVLNLSISSKNLYSLSKNKNDALMISTIATSLYENSYKNSKKDIKDLIKLNGFEIDNDRLKKIIDLKTKIKKLDEKRVIENENLSKNMSILKLDFKIKKFNINFYSIAEK